MNVGRSGQGAAGGQGQPSLRRAVLRWCVAGLSSLVWAQAAPAQPRTTLVVAAYGMFFIPRAYGTSIQMTGDASAALWGFLTFYISCLALTWFVYARRGGLLHDIERNRGGNAAGEARRSERRV